MNDMKCVDAMRVPLRRRLGFWILDAAEAFALSALPRGSWRRRVLHWVDRRYARMFVIHQSHSC